MTVSGNDDAPTDRAIIWPTRLSSLTLVWPTRLSSLTLVALAPNRTQAVQKRLIAVKAHTCVRAYS